MELLWDRGMKVCSNGPGHMTKIATMPIYGKNLKHLLLWNQKADDIETWYASSGARVLPSLLRWWPWADLDLKNVYKIRLHRDFFETWSKWPKWKEVSVDIKILSSVGCLPLTCSYIHLLNHEKMCIKSEVEEIFLKLATNDQSGSPAPAQGLYTCIKSWKNVHKIRGQSYFLIHATSDQSDKTFLLQSKKMSLRVGCLLLPWGYMYWLHVYIHVWNKTKCHTK